MLQSAFPKLDLILIICVSKTISINKQKWQNYLLFIKENAKLDVLSWVIGCEQNWSTRVIFDHK